MKISTTPHKTTAHPTEVKCVDQLLGGGASQEGANVILGTIGGGKTTLATMIASEGASRAVADGSNGGKWLYCTTSQRLAEIQDLAIAYLAQRDRQIGLACRPCVERSSATFLSSGEHPTSQLTPQQCLTAAAATAALGLSIMTLDISGFMSEYFDEQLLAMIECHCRTNKISRLKGVVIDDMHIAFSRHFRQCRGLTDQRLFSAGICQAILRLGAMLRWRGSVLWMVYPLSEGRVNDNLLHIPTHRDAMDSRNVGSVISSAIVLIPKNFRPSILLAQCTKSPFADRSVEPMILEFPRDLASLEVTNKYKIDHRGKLVPNNRERPIMDEIARSELEQYLEIQRDMAQSGTKIGGCNSKRAKTRRKPKG